MSINDLPAINATLNGLSAVMLAAGFYFIKKGNRRAHQKCMIGAFSTSVVFLICYLTYHYTAGHTSFKNPDWFRPIYLTLLFTHVVLAVAIVPLILKSIYHAAKGDFEKHKKVAKWTWPLWMYVSVTGVVIYLLLYQIFPQAVAVVVP